MEGEMGLRNKNSPEYNGLTTIICKLRISGQEAKNILKEKGLI